MRKKILALASILIFLSVDYALAESEFSQMRIDVYGTPVAIRSADGSRWLKPILVLSDSSTSVYVGQDAIISNLVYSQDYLQNKKFLVKLYTKIKNKAHLRKAINQLKSDMLNNTVTGVTEPYPDHLRYIATSAYFDVRNNKVIFDGLPEIYISENGEMIGCKTMTGTQELSKYFGKIALKLVAILDRANNDQQIIDARRNWQGNRDAVAAMARSARGRNTGNSINDAEEGSKK